MAGMAGMGGGGGGGDGDLSTMPGMEGLTPEQHAAAMGAMAGMTSEEHAAAMAAGGRMWERGGQVLGQGGERERGWRRGERRAGGLLHTHNFLFALSSLSKGCVRVGGGALSLDGLPVPSMPRLGGWRRAREARRAASALGRPRDCGRLGDARPLAACGKGPRAWRPPLFPRPTPARPLPTRCSEELSLCRTRPGKVGRHGKARAPAESGKASDGAPTGGRAPPRAFGPAGQRVRADFAPHSFLFFFFFFSARPSLALSHRAPTSPFLSHTHTKHQATHPPQPFFFAF